MSVAFRRESDEEHLEPRFGIPIPSGPNLVTADGLRQIESKVAELDSAVASTADGPDREALLREQRYWRNQLATAEPMPEPDGDTVQFGCRVRFSLNGQERSVAIVGHDEADPQGGKLSYSAPLSRALMDAEIGDLVDFNGKAGAIRILDITVR